MGNATICKEDARREAVRAGTELNGLDYVEVDDDQVTLTLYFLGKAPEQLIKGATRHLRVEGGRRIRGIRVIDLDVVRDPDPEVDDYAVLRVDKAGDFSPYTLRIVGLEGIDPFYDHVEFSFKVNCPGELDCAVAEACPPPQRSGPDINYLAKDYASFRQLLLDRLALIMPDWQERHVPDLGITLVEILAYVGDHLSYYQDAVATEAYLGTSRRRISVRRHARLVDYRLHEGCNARTWLCISTDSDWTGEHALDPRRIFFITSLPDSTAADSPILTMEELKDVSPGAYEPFEAVACGPVELYAFHSEIRLYTWGERECCLPRGATTATLVDAWETPAADQPATIEMPGRKLRLKAGDILVFREVLGPVTGQAADADPSHRHAVRLTGVYPGEDPLNGQPLLEVEWSEEDLLPFPLCLSATTDSEHGCEYREGISVACGNVILVDHGITIDPEEELGRVPTETTDAECDCEGHPGDVSYLAGRFGPRLSEAPLTFRQPLPADSPRPQSAASWLGQDPRQALPQISLTGTLALRDNGGCLFDWGALTDHPHMVEALCTAGFAVASFPRGVPLSPDLFAAYAEAAGVEAELAKALEQDPDNQRLKDEHAKAGMTVSELQRALIAELASRTFRWEPRNDLLASSADDRHFVVEMDNEGVARLRFGDGQCGRRPEASSLFHASYRVGNGTRGNVGAESIRHLVFRDNGSDGGSLNLCNPMAASGGTDPESLAEAKLLAPSAFRSTPMRAVIAADYASLAQREFAGSVQRAAAKLAWTGSWYEADVAIDPFGSEDAAPELLARIEHRLHRYRRMGHDLEVEAARYVPIRLELSVCVRPHFLRGHVRAALLDLFSNRLLADGRRGFFHPDNLTFGEGLYLSRIVAAAQGVSGVEGVRVTGLNRLFEPPNRELENGVLPLGPLEVAQLDNDPSFPERGILKLSIKGGR